MTEEDSSNLLIDPQGTLSVVQELDGYIENQDRNSEVGFGVIKVCEDGTLTTKICLPNGKEIYLGMEKTENINEKLKWQQYMSANSLLGTQLSDISMDLGCCSKKFYDRLCKDKSSEFIEDIFNKNQADFLSSSIFQKDTNFSDEDFRPGFQELISLEGTEFDEFVNMFKNALKDNPSIQDTLRRTIAGSAGFDSDWRTYASVKPITGKLQVKSDPLPLKTFKLLSQDFGNVIMSVQNAQYPELPVYQNREIAKNVYWVIKGGYDQLSMVLHSFTGAVAQKFWTNKIYMTVSPLPSMQKIIVKSLGKGELFIGDNKHKPYPDFPPLLHRLSRGVSRYTIRIAKEGVDTSEFSDSELPDELTQFTQDLDYSKSLASRLEPNHESPYENANYIKIEALVKKFEIYCGNKP